MSVHKGVTAALFVAVITALLLVALAYSPATSKADAQSAAPTAKAEPTGRASYSCGFNRLRQVWRNCQNYRYRIYGSWYEGATGAGGNFVTCARPGLTYLYRVVPFGSIATSAYKGRRGC